MLSGQGGQPTIRKVYLSGKIKGTKIVSIPKEDEIKVGDYVIVKKLTVDTLGKEVGIS